MRVFIFYYFVTNYHKRSHLKQQVIISEFLWVRSPGVAEVDLLLRVSKPAVQESSTLLHSSFGAQGPLPSFEVLVRIQLLVVVGLRLPITLVTIGWGLLLVHRDCL